MSKTFRTLSLCVVMGLVSVGCQKENTIEMSSQVSNAKSVRKVCYTIDGQEFRAELLDENAWQGFVEKMCGFAKSGCQVFFWNENETDQVYFSKETLTYSTADEKDTTAWCKDKFDRGYKVGMTYDEKEGVFICVAIR